MKKIISLIVIVVAAIGFASTANAKKIAPSQVPSSLREFVQTHFGKDVSIVKADRDHSKGGYEYDVTLSNACEIEYGVSEEWLEVDAKKGSVPPTIIGDGIMSHIQVNYPAATVRKIERKAYGYEVKLNNGVHLKYDKNFKFISAK